MTSAPSITLQLQPYFEQGLELWLESGMLRFKAPKEVLTPTLMALLKQNKEAILAWLQTEASLEKSAPKLLDEYPLAFTQGAIWMLYRFAPSSPAYNTTFACVLHGGVNETAVRQAFHALLIRHPVLRSTFSDTDTGPRQRVWDHIEMPLQILDGSQWNQQQLDAQLHQEADAPFDLQTQSCLRVKIIRNSVLGDILIATIHHVGADLWALLIVAKDIKDFYQRAAKGDVLSLEPLTVTYRQHVEWQQQFMDSPRGKKERRFWQRALRGAPMTVTLPTDFARPPVLQLKTSLIRQDVQGDSYRAIKQFCKSRSITPFVFVQTALQILVHHYSGADDFLVGTPTMGRARKGMDQVVGDFANPVVLRATLQDSTVLAALLQQVKKNLLAAMEHQEYPFPAVVQDCNPPRDSSRTPLYQLMFVWHQGNADMLAQDEWIKSILPLSGPRGAPYDVMLAVSDLSDRFELNWTYQTTLYRGDTIEHFAADMQRIMSHLLQTDTATTVADCVAACWSQTDDGNGLATLQVDALPPFLQPWLQQWQQDNTPVLGLAVTRQNGQACLPHESGWLALQTGQGVRLTPMQARCDGQRISVTGCKPGWGLLQNQLVDLRALLARRQPLLQALDYCVTTQAIEQRGFLQRLFVGCGDQSRRDELQTLLQGHLPGIDDVTLYPQLPRQANGEFDSALLSQRPYVDHAAIEKRLADLSGKPVAAGDAVVVLRKPVIQPSFDDDELGDKARSATAVAPLRHLDISQRPDAWVVGAPMAVAADQPRHLFEALQITARRFPERGLILLDSQLRESRYSYAQLIDDAHIAAAGFQRAGIAAGAIVLLQMRFDRRFFAVWWGAVLAGIRPLNVATPDQYSQRNGVAQKLYNVAHNFAELTVVADRERVQPTRQWLGESKQVIDADALLEQQERYDCAALSADPVAFLQLTSGSTGTPKAIQITHQGILHHIASSAAHNGYSSDDISLNWLPFDHVVPILTTHIKDCVLGIQQVQLPTASVLEDPLLWLQAMSDYRVTYSWAPNFAFQRVVEALHQASQLPELDLSCVKILMNAGEQVLAPAVKAFYAGCAVLGLRENTVQPAFGMAEACTCITYNNESSQLLSVHFNNSLDPAVCDITDAAKASHGFVDLGSLVPGVEIRITDENNRLVKEGVIGRMQIRGPVVTPGYLNNPDANAEAFVGDGWFNSGDLGIIWNRRLILTGREKEMIVVRGANYYCFELEQVVATLPGVVPTFVAATGVALSDGGNSDGLVLFYVSDNSVDATQLERQIGARVAEAFGVTPEYVIAVEQDNFHKTTSGKIQRGQFKKNFEKDVYASAVESYLQRHNEPRDSVKTLFSLQWETVAASDAQSPTMPLQLLVWDDMADSALLTAVRACSRQTTLIPAQAPELADFIATAVATAIAQEDCRCLLLLGSLQQTDDPDAQLWHITRRIGTLVPVLAQLNQRQAERITLALGADFRDAVLLFKPLLETLRQETGLQVLQGCVLQQDAPQVATLLSRMPVASPLPQWIGHDSIVRPLLGAASMDAASTPALVRAGTYLITGGLGGLAESLCDFLLTQQQARLILAGRSALQSNAKRLAQFRQLQARYGAARIQYLQLQEWNSEVLAEKIPAALQELASKTLDGVFHLAGHLDMQPLTQLTPEHWRDVTAAKISGAQVLSHYLQQHWPRSLLVQYGSLNSFFGGQAAAVYSLANAAQAQLTRHLNQHTSIRAWCLHWSVWQGTGMAQQFSSSDLQMARNKGLIALDLQKDQVWLTKALQLPPDNYYIGIDAGSAAMETQLDWYSDALEQISVHIAPVDTGLDAQSVAKELAQIAVREITPRIGEPQLEQHLWREPWPRDERNQLLLSRLRNAAAAEAAHTVPPADDTERALVEIWSKVLARPIPDVTRSFFEYGGHSINATQLVAAINQRFGLSLNVATLFQFSSVRELAHSLQQNAEQPSGYLSLALQDCISRGEDFRLDCVDPASDSSVNVIFLPTAAGIGSVYMQLMARLTRFRLHVLSMPLARAGEQPIQQAATQFIGLIDQQGIRFDSVVLAGWSMGGVLGYEMLRQLSLQNRALPRLAMFDSGFGVGLHPITFDENFQLLMFAVELGLSQEHFAAFNQCSNLQTKLVWLKQYLDTLSIEVSPELLLQWSIAYRTRLQSLEHYAAGDGISNADISLVKAALHPHGREDLGWGETNKNIKWQSVQADHQGIVKHPEVGEWFRNLCLHSEKTNG